MEKETDYREGVEKDHPVPAIGIIAIRDLTNNLCNRTKLKHIHRTKDHHQHYADQRDEENLPSLQHHRFVTH